MAKHPFSSSVRHIEPQSFKRRVGHRPAGGITYPVQYCNDLADFDIWHHMFLFSYCKSITMHNFDTAPGHVLDLGCGSGFWVMEAAKQWTNSTIIGYDYVDMQPRLGSIPHLSSIASRVRWVHGNFLDGLAFPDAHFDFVRIAGLALAVPEDEWQKLFEEVYRVLKPGGIVEVIEDDLVFPCASALLQPVKPRPRYHSTTDAKSLDRLQRSLEQIHHQAISTPNVNDIYAGNRLAAFVHVPLPLLSGSSTVTLASADSTDETEHPQDHSRLKHSWDAMLASRFLSPKVTSVLPFYMTSAGFDNLTSLPQLTVSLPPSSGFVSTTTGANKSNSNNSHNALSAHLSVLRSVRSADSLVHPPSHHQHQLGRLRLSSTILDFGPPLSQNTTPFPSRPPSPITPSPPASKSATGFSSARKSLPPRSSPGRMKSGMTTAMGGISSGMMSSWGQGQGPVWGTMHLAKVVSTIRGCKEAMWREYNAEHGVEEARYLLMLTAPEEDTERLPDKYVERRAFEVDWMNWELDMQDRMNMRRLISSNTAWPQPSEEPDGPEHKKWREKLDGSRDTSSSPASSIFHQRTRHLVAPSNTEDVCRSLRAFTARRPS